MERSWVRPIMFICLEICLIRRLEENAVNLSYAFLGLTNKYELEGFDEKRQATLTALVACCPQKAAQYVDPMFTTKCY